MTTFFPQIGFSWAFVSVIVGLLLVAAYLDFRTLTIPKPVVFAILGSGLVANLIRGAWLGEQGRAVLLFGGSWWTGLLDGFLFSLAGFLVGFVLLFVLWVLGTCGGGDVKLMAALGAWLGPVFVVYAWLGSVAVLLVFVVGQLAFTLVSGKPLVLPTKATGTKSPRWRTSYSFPVAIATLLVLLLCCRVDLGLTTPHESPEAKVVSHGP